MRSLAPAVMLLCGVWSGTAAADPRSCESLSASEQASCDEYATQTERIARGRGAGFSVYSPLNAAREACAAHPNDDKVCKGFPGLARMVHREKLSDAASSSVSREDATVAEANACLAFRRWE